MNGQPLQFFVHIVESPSPENLLDGLTEGRMLCSFLELAQIPCVYNLAVDRTQFHESLSTRLVLGVQTFNLLPILHFSTHGNNEGIQLTGQREVGEVLDWKALSELILPINQAFGGELGVCMSTCGGAHGRRMAEVIRREQIPMGWIVGSTASVSFCDAALAFCVFYRGLQRGGDIESLIAAVQAASGISDFNVDFGHLVHEQYAQRVREKLAKLIGSFGQGQSQPQSKVNESPLFHPNLQPGFFNVSSPGGQ